VGHGRDRGGGGLGIQILAPEVVVPFAEPTQESVLTDVFTSDVSSLFILVLAVVGITGEWRHRTITSSLLAAPDRLRFLAAKTIAFAAAGLALSLVISLAVAVVGFTILSVRDLPTPDAGELAGQIGRIALVAALLGAWGWWSALSCETRWWPSSGCSCSRSSSSLP
jgi:hypothetical protein